jgi:hypothetical protein
MSKRIVNRVRGYIKPHTVSQIEEYKKRTGSSESAIVREALELLMTKVNPPPSQKNTKNRV